jgi:coenzyme PQQ precursor peptide PqqA
MCKTHVSGGLDMAWKKPVLREISCGMEINMYGPAEDDDVLF